MQDYWKNNHLCYLIVFLTKDTCTCFAKQDYTKRQCTNDDDTINEGNDEAHDFIDAWGLFY